MKKVEEVKEGSLIMVNTLPYVVFEPVLIGLPDNNY